VNRSDGTIATRNALSLGIRGATQAAAADFDGDGDVDVAFGVQSGDAIVVLWNDGDATFAAEEFTAGVSFPAHVVAADLDGDGRVDLAVGTSERGPLRVLYNRGGGEFSLTEEIPLVDCHRRQFMAADLDGDGDVDFLVTGGFCGVSVLVNDGGGSFALRSVDPREVPQGSVHLLDWNSDGATDFVMADQLFLNESHLRGELFFGGPLTLPIEGSTVAAIDIDGDGNDDVVGSLADRLSVFLNGVRPALQLPRKFRLDRPPDVLEFADFDGDGLDDVAALSRVGTGGQRFTRLTIVCNATLAARSDDADSNGVPDECGVGTVFHRGDANDDGALTVADAIFLLAHLFASGESSGCAETADADNSGALNLTDPVFVLRYLFASGPPPGFPGPPGVPCAADADVPGSPSDLGCEEYRGCE